MNYLISKVSKRIGILGPPRGALLCIKSEALEAARPIGAGAYPGFCSMKRLEVFLLPLDGMLVHRRVYYVYWYYNLQIIYFSCY